MPRIQLAPVRADLFAHGRYVAMVGVVALAATGVWAMRGLPQRFSNEVLALAPDVVPGGPYARPCFSVVKDVPPPCIVGRRTDQAAVTMIRDSHSEAIVSALVAALPDAATGGVAFNGYASCAPLIGARSTDLDNKCSEFVARYLPPLTRPRTTPLILVARWPYYMESPSITFPGEATASAAAFGRHLLKSSCALARGGPTYLLLPTPEFPFEVAHEMQRRLMRSPHAPDITLSLAVYRAQTRPIMPWFRQAAAQCGVRLLDPTPYLCAGFVCAGTIGHRAIYRDEDHMTEFGNKLLTPLFRSLTM